MRADANHYMKAIFQQEVREKKKGKNHDLTVAEYKVAKEEEKIEKLSTDKIGLEADILVLNHKKSTKQKKLDELDGLCWFPRLMRWQTSKGEVSPVFEDIRNEGYYYRLKSYMDIHTRQEYPKELIQPEIKPENRTGTIEQLAQNVEAVEKQVRLMGVGMSQNHKCQSWQIIK